MSASKPKVVLLGWVQIQPRETLTKNRGQVLQMAQKTPAKKAHAEDPHYSQAVQNYEAGLKALQERKFDKAKTHLQKVLEGPKELADRASVHLNICNRSEEHTSELQSRLHLVCRLLLEKKKRWATTPGCAPPPSMQLLRASLSAPR